MFLGGSSVNLDAKGRLALPTRYRAIIQDRFDSRLVLTVHDDGCLLLYPHAVWEDIQRALMRLPNQNRRARLLQRMVLGHATEVEMDAQGRILVAPRLREFAKLDKRVALAGVGNKFEIWNEEAGERNCGEWQEGDSDEALTEDLEQLTL